MINKYISGEMIIAAMHDEYNVIGRDWESRAPRWIYDNIKNLKISLNMGTYTEDIKFDNYTFDLPCSLEVLRGIFINNKRLEQTRVVGHKLTNKDIADHGVTDLRYYSIDGGTVTTEIKSGTAQIVYTKLLLDWNERLSMYIPKVPDIPEVIDNTKLYVLKIILARGYKHPVYSLVSNNQFNNPAIKWELGLKRARSAARPFTKQKREEVSQVLTEFLPSNDPAIEDLITEKYRTNINYNI